MLKIKIGWLLATGNFEHIPYIYQVYSILYKDDVQTKNMYSLKSCII